MSDSNLYNHQVKQNFMDNYGTGTQKIFNRLFSISKPLEEDFNKDLCEFNLNELRSVFFLCLPKTESSSAANVTYLNKYLQYCIDNKIKKGINQLSMVDAAWKRQFANVSIKRFWTDVEIDETVKQSANPSDQSIILLLFFGAQGDNYSEITNLKLDDINRETNELTLTNEDGSKRTIKVDPECTRILLRSAVELEYEKGNGTASEELKAKFGNLVNNNYVIKLVNTKTTHFQDADYNVIYRRLKAVRSNETFFNPTNIMRSGQLSMLKRFLDEYGEIRDEHLEEIGTKFNLDMDHVKRATAEYLNVDTIEQVYGKS